MNISTEAREAAEQEICNQRVRHPWVAEQLLGYYVQELLNLATAGLREEAEEIAATIAATGLTENEDSILGRVQSICNLAAQRCVDVNKLREQLHAKDKELRQERDTLKAENERLTRESRKVEWACSDCGYSGDNFRTVEENTPNGYEYNCICGECGSTNTGEIGEVLHTFANERDALRARCETLEEEKLTPADKAFAAARASITPPTP